MKTGKWFYALMVLALLISTFGTTTVQAQELKRPTRQSDGVDRDTLFVPGEVVVGFSDGLQGRQYAALAQALAGNVGAQVVDQYGGMALLSFDPSVDVVGLASQIGSQSAVQYAQPNYVSWVPEANPRGVRYNLTTVRSVLNSGGDYGRGAPSIEQEKLVRTLLSMRTGKKASAYPGDGFENWGWYMTGTWKIWVDKKVAANVCELDTGVDGMHPDLKGRIINGLDFVNDDSLPNDDNGHGTHVAGTMVAIANNKIGLAGLSNGKVVAVKVLSASGWGTTFDIAAGIRYCANRADIRVINMSLGGGSPSNAEWLALDYAINNKGKLLVAAAGNSSENTDAFPLYPAAWADPDLAPNGAGLGGSFGNNISQALLSVGATSGYDHWIDLDNDLDGGFWDFDNDTGDADYWDEHFYDCAAGFSNYGEHVEIVAPGEDIFSTTPVSYPFEDAYVYGVSAGYEWFSGTSMATPHVAAAAARVWGTFNTSTNSQIKARLLAGGDLVEVQEDPAWNDHDIGFNDMDYTGEAPYCWPETMEDSVHLNLALSMERTAIDGTAVDGQNGLPLVGTVATIKKNSNNAVVPTATTGLIDSFNSRFYEILNVPVDAFYNVLLNKPGYTAGAQHVGWVYADFDCRFCASFNPTAYATILPNVAGRYNVTMDFYGWLDMDIHLFLPPGAPDYEVWLGQPGTMRDFPYARYYRENTDSFVGSESIAIHKMGSTLHYGGVGNYQLFIEDFDGTAFDDDFLMPIIRFWDAGVVKEINWPFACAGDDVYHAFDLGNPGITRTFVDECGDGGLYPYALPDSMQGIPEGGNRK